MKKVRMIRIAEEAELQRILETLHQNAKNQIELIELDDWNMPAKRLARKMYLNESGIQPASL